MAWFLYAVVPYRLRKGEIVNYLIESNVKLMKNRIMISSSTELLGVMGLLLSLTHW